MCQFHLRPCRSSDTEHSTQQGFCDHDTVNLVGAFDRRSPAPTASARDLRPWRVAQMRSTVGQEVTTRGPVMKRILVGIDRLSGAVAALSWSAQVARRGSFQLSVVGGFATDQMELAPLVS